MTAQRPFAGIQAIKAADERRALEARRSDWPYTHIFPPPTSIPLHVMTQTPVQVPAVGTSAVVLTYQVPDGMRAYIIGILQSLSVGGGGLGGFSPGDIVWTVTENQAPVGAPVSVQGAPVQGLVQIPVPLGSWVDGVWWPIPRVYEFEENTVLASNAKNVTNNIPSSGGNLLVSGFFGWLLPAQEVENK